MGSGGPGRPVEFDPREFRAARWWPFDELAAADAARFDPNLSRFLDKLLSQLDHRRSVARTLSRMTEGREELLAAQYFAAVAGMAAMRHCLTAPSTVRARLDDVRAVVDRLDEFPNDLVVPLVEYEVSRGYDAWAPRYDEPNPAVEADKAAVHSLLADIEGRVALDAACGTGRHSAYLHERGFEVIGVDFNRSMLAVAESKVPAGDFRLGDLSALPVDDDTVDVVVCSLALTHVERLEPVIAEFARVTRPGGVVILSDIHPTAVTFGGGAVFPTESARFELHFVRDLVHGVSDYIRAAMAAGLVVRDCREPVVPETVIRNNPAYPVVPDAVRQAFEGLPFLLVWSLEKPRPPG